MPGQICFALNQFFTQVIKMRRQSYWENLGINKKNNDLLFLRFYNCEPLEERVRGKSQMSPMPSNLMQPSWDPQVQSDSFGGQKVLTHSLIDNKL